MPGREGRGLDVVSRPEGDVQALDTWAAERTGGLIPAMPLQVDGATLLVLAAAQAVRTKWLSPFHATGLVPDDEGPWAGRTLVGLSRRTSLLDRVVVAQTPAGDLTVLQVLGNTGVDVHLLLGEGDAAPGAVLAAGIDVLSGVHRATPGDRLPLGEPGPGLYVRNVRAGGRDPVLSVTTSPFSLTADHDLLATSDSPSTAPSASLTVHRTSRLVLSAGWIAEPVDHVLDEYDHEYEYDEDEDEDD
ncbi:hypothetical protein [Streptomyces exfoliatus]|uniref:hypothetical protein n=1 Tax=Streptomyces exfoliatus TaxID=1905 RepID=UPI000465498A|nr:hypothetical protein [Streptomyces exfoliatus]